MPYIIIRNKTIHHEGDERSRTNPGHGYPAYSETVQSVEYFESEIDNSPSVDLLVYKKFEDRCKQLTERKESFRAFNAHEYMLKTNVSVEIVPK